MKILTLGTSALLLQDLLHNHEVFHEENSINLSNLIDIQPDLIISFGYRHLIKKDVIDYFPNRIINLHISLLPWNRGADPNFWSWFDNTPKGVTIHLIDEGLDTGSILFQKTVNLHDSETLASSYEILQSEIIALFESKLDEILQFKFALTNQQLHAGSKHNSRDKDVYFQDLKSGWNTKCSEIKELGRRFRAETA